MTDVVNVGSGTSSTSTSSEQGFLQEVEQERHRRGDEVRDEESNSTSSDRDAPEYVSRDGVAVPSECAQSIGKIQIETVKDVDEDKSQREDILEYMNGDRPPEYDVQGLVELWNGEGHSVSVSSNLMTDDFDIVIVHGFWGARRPPWKNPGSGDSTWLYGQGTLRCRKVMSFGYDPLSLLSGTCTRDAIKNVAGQLLDELKAVKESSSKMRPLIFIAHDIGGIIVKDALAHAQCNPHSYGILSDTTRLLIFYGCPHRASHVLDMEQRLSRFIYGLSAIERPAACIPTSAAKYLAEATMEINDSYLLSKHMFRSYTISIFSDNDYGGIDKIFDNFCATMGFPFEIRLTGGLNVGDDRKQIEETVHGISPFLTVNEHYLHYERLLLSTASPLLALRTSGSLVHPYAWISETTAYQSWRNQRNPGLLYLNGGPDTRLASEFVFHDLDQLHTQRKGQTVLYFSFDRHDIRKSHAIDMLATFLAQIFNHFPNRSEVFISSKLEQFRSERSWHITDLFHLLESCRHSVVDREISYVLTNFDECEPESRKAFLNFFHYISQTSERPWRIVVTSGQPGALTEELSGWPNLDLNPSVREIADDADHEILSGLRLLLLRQRPEARVYKKRVDEDLQAIACLDSDVRDLVIKHITLNPNWPSKGSVTDIFGNAEGMSLQTVVRKILDNVPDRELTGRALAWTLNAKRPLSHRELAIAAVFRSGDANVDFGPHFCEAADKVVDQLRTWLTGILNFDNNRATISTHRIRGLLTATSENQSSCPYLLNLLGANPHCIIAGTCLAYLMHLATQQGLARLYDSSLYENTCQAMEGDHIGLQEYSVQYWMYHTSQVSHEHDSVKDLAAFINSGVFSNWSKAYWALANPFTRSKRPFESPYPILAGGGLANLAERWREDDKELLDGLSEAYLNGSSLNVGTILSQGKFSIEDLNDALSCAGAKGDEKAWEGLIDHIHEDHPAFPWKDQAEQVVRASCLGLNNVLARLLSLGCQADTPYNYSEKAGPQMPLQQAIYVNNIGAARLLLEHGASLTFEADGHSTALHVAAKYGHSDMVKLLAGYGVDMNARTTSFLLPVYLACLWGKPKVLKALLDLGADPNLKVATSQHEPAWSPLTCAVQVRNIDCVRALLNANAKPDIVGPSGTPLWYAISNGSFEICQLLLERGADPNSTSNPVPILAHAASASDLRSRTEIVKLLHAKGAVIDAVTADGSTALAWACWSDDQHKHSIVRYLLQNGADVNLPRQDGVRPIHISILKHDVELLRILLEQKTVEIAAGQMTPLVMAVCSSSHSKELTRILLENNADPNACSGNEDSALLCAVERNAIELVDLLLQYKARIDPPDEMRDDSMWEPLEEAVVNGRADIIRSLAEAGADINRRFGNGFSLVHRGINSGSLGALLEFRPTLDVKSDKGSTPLHCIDELTPVENIKLLVRAGSDVNATGWQNTTPLIEALRFRQEEAARYLLSKEADIGIISPLFGSPLHAACGSGLVDIVKDLIDRGADVNLAVPGPVGTPLSSIFLSSIWEGFVESDDECKTMLTEILLEAGANIQTSNRLFGTVSGAAAWAGEVLHLRLLAAKGASFDGCDSLGRTPLHLAALSGSREVTSFILDNGGRATEKDKAGRSVISWAAQGGNTALLNDLLQLIGRHAINEADSDGWTPLCWAARAIGTAKESDEASHLEMIKELLDNGADRSVRSRIPGKEYTPAGIAKYHGRDNEAVKLLTPSAEDRQRSIIQEMISIDELDGMPNLATNERLRKAETGCDFCLLGCGGLMYTCKTCPDFTFCYKCFNSKDTIHPAHHEFEEDGPEFEKFSMTSHSGYSSPVPSSSESSISSSPGQYSDDDSSSADGRSDTR